MNISIITPASAHARSGNHNTAARWAKLLRDRGHRVTIAKEWGEAQCDVMIALHARKSHSSIARFAAQLPERPLIVALTGTDLYRDIESDTRAQRSLALATRLIVLQELGCDALPASCCAKTHVVYQSARTIARAPHLASSFEVVVSGHLREEKDPFRAAAALQYLPRDSRIRVTHVGAALSGKFAAEARQWMEREPRYRWLGEVPHGRALRILARSRLVVVSSRLEGGANVVSEALANKVPVIASRIAGNVGMLGSKYRGYYAMGNERALAALLCRAETDRVFYRLLGRQCAVRAHLTEPRREQKALAGVVTAAVAAARINAALIKAA